VDVPEVGAQDREIIRSVVHDKGLAPQSLQQRGGADTLSVDDPRGSVLGLHLDQPHLRDPNVEGVPVLYLILGTQVRVEGLGVEGDGDLGKA
jgi:hypothetical protein